MIRLHDILDMVSAYNADADLDLIKKAYVFSAKAHQGQTRRSGEPYLVHPVEVAGILAQMKLDVPSIVAALLHDTVEDTVATLEELERVFGREIMELVDGVTKLGQIQFQTTQQKQAENFRKMIMAMAKDIRVILVKLADRVHNMRTLEHMPENRRVAIAQETLDIYAPIANRLGIQQMKIELEDMSFKYLKPDVYQIITTNLSKHRSEREKYIEETKKLVQEKMNEHFFRADIFGRSKHLYSIHRKMERQKIPFDEIYDLIAFRIIVDTLAQCYESLGIIHALWRPIPGRFKDYIAMPKANNYQSLHTTVIGPHGERVEFQIRTHEMNEVAEKGIAAHWKYKESGGIAGKDELKFKWIRQLLQWQRELDEPAEFLDTIKLDLFADDIYIFTPTGEVRELPRGATSVDFAYEIHTDVGHSCVGAKVNGKIVPLRHPLRSGDTVEIITQKIKRPNKDWLQFVKTSRAKAKIRQFIKQEQRDNGLVIGRELFQKECERLGLSPSKILKGKEMERYVSEGGFSNIDSLMIDIGYGKIQAEKIIQKIEPTAVVTEEVPPKIRRPSRLLDRFTRAKGLVKIDGISDVLVTFGKCCNPVPGDSIVGFVTRGRGVSIHVSDCPRILASDSARYIPVAWNTGAGLLREAKLKVICVNKPGMLSNMTEAITSKSVNITQAHSRTMDDQRAVNIFEVAIKDTEQLRKVMLALEKVKGVISVERMRV